MSIRIMMPMGTSSAVSRVTVRALASKLGEAGRALTLVGAPLNLIKPDRRIIDQLTLLVRNSLDTVEMPEKRALRKNIVGNLEITFRGTSGREYCIEVTDDGAGLNRERITAKAMSRGWR